MPENYKRICLKIYDPDNDTFIDAWTLSIPNDLSDQNKQEIIAGWFKEMSIKASYRAKQYLKITSVQEVLDAQKLRVIE